MDADVDFVGESSILVDNLDEFVKPSLDAALNNLVDGLTVIQSPEPLRLGSSFNDIVDFVTAWEDFVDCILVFEDPVDDLTTLNGFVDAVIIVGDDFEDLMLEVDIRLTFSAIAISNFVVVADFLIRK